MLLHLNVNLYLIIEALLCLHFIKFCHDLSVVKLMIILKTNMLLLTNMAY